jgi:hypothetical protein
VLARRLTSAPEKGVRHPFCLPGSGKIHPVSMVLPLILSSGYNGHQRIAKDRLLMPVNQSSYSIVTSDEKVNRLFYSIDIFSNYDILFI